MTKKPTTKKTAKAKTAKKTKANGATRHRIPDDAKLTLVANNFRDGSFRHQVASLVKNGMTVGTFREKGKKIVGDAIGSFLRDFVKNGTVKVGT